MGSISFRDKLAALKFYLHRGSNQLYAVSHFTRTLANIWMQTEGCLESVVLTHSDFFDNKMWTEISES